MTSDPYELRAELEAALLRRLAGEWSALNWSLFKSSMRVPVFELDRSRTHLGAYHTEGRRLVLSRVLVLDRPWVETLEVLKHEMAHQFVFEVLGGEERPHGPLFHSVCEARGIDPAATERRDPSEGALPHAPRSEDKIIGKVRKLLALAESTNRHEAELAAATAQRMMLKFNVDLGEHASDDRAAFGKRFLGKPKGRVQAHEYKLANLLITHFFVEGIWIPVYRPREGKSGSVLEICGRHENLEMAEFVHAFVSRTIEHLWVEHKRAHGIELDRARRGFLSGAIDGFSDKLATQEVRCRKEGLVWAGDRELERWFSRRHPRIHHGSGARGGRELDAYEHGRSAGGNIVLSGPIESRGSSGGRQRALPPGK